MKQPALEDCEPIDGFDVLDKIVELPVSTWRYKWEPDSIRHLGPMAQDWTAAFGVGVNDRTICCVDANGVAMVGIQGVHRLIDDLRIEVSRLRDEVAALKAEHTRKP